MKKKLETVQIWSKKGLSDLSGETYFARRRALLNGISMINRLQFFKPEDEVAALQLIEILEQISRLKETLLAACRAAETLSSADSKIAAEKVFILETIDSSEKALQKVKENLLRRRTVDSRTVVFVVYASQKQYSNERDTAGRNRKKIYAVCC